MLRGMILLRGCLVLFALETLTGQVLSQSVTPSSRYTNGTYKYPAEVRAMIDIRIALTNNISGYIPEWNLTASPDICTWAGLTCTSDGHVSTIIYFNTYLGGTLSPAFANLTSLQSVDLHSTNLNGTIPFELAALSSLEVVKLHVNNLTGGIPTQFGHSNLRTLNLYDNQLNGAFPDSVWNSTSLTRLSVQYNNLTGTLPAAVGNLTHLKQLRINNNGFSGSIPEEIGNLSELELLGLGNNSFSGAIPDSIGKLSSLTGLGLGANQLDGPVPSSIWNLTNLSTLNLSFNKLGGTLPDGVSALTKLQVLDAHSNILSGVLPSDFSNTTSLEYLDLGQNFFAGPFPDLSNNTNLVYLDVSGSQFNGSFPNLPPLLQNMNLQGNQLSGSIPDNLANLTALTSVDFSDNYLNGTVSQALQDFLTKILNSTAGQVNGTTNSSAKYVLQSSASTPSWQTPLQGNCFRSNAQPCPIYYNGICYLLNQRDPGQCDVPELPQHKTSNTPTLIIILCLLGAAVIAAICGGGGFYALLRRRKKEAVYMQAKSINVKRGGPIVSMRVNRGGGDAEVGDEPRTDLENGVAYAPGSLAAGVAAAAAGGRLVPNGTPVGGWTPRNVGVPELSLEQLREVTNNFSTVLGSGAVGDVYKGVLPSGQEVAAKVLLETDEQSITDAMFLDDVSRVYKLQHPHLANLVAFTQDGGTWALVNEYAPGGSLFDRLHGGGTVLSWSERMRIALGVASGLEYLHQAGAPNGVHGDIKSSNVLLTRDGAAKVSDYGISKERLLGQEGDPLASASNLRGGFGYVDPEYAGDKRLTEKSDVYSFGVLLFELVTGRKAMEEDSSTLRVWVQDYLQSRDKLPGMVDPALGAVPFQELETVVAIAQTCTKGSRSARPTMADVKKALVDRLRISPEVAAPQQYTDDSEASL